MLNPTPQARPFLLLCKASSPRPQAQNPAKIQPHFGTSGGAQGEPGLIAVFDYDYEAFGDVLCGKEVQFLVSGRQRVDRTEEVVMMF